MRTRGILPQNPIKMGRSAISIALLGIIILACVAVPVSAAKLTTPVQTIPANNQHFYNLFGFSLLAWKPVTGATTYFVEVQQKSGSNWLAYTSALQPGITHYWNTFDTTKTYRWRVFANNSNPADASNPTAWRTFDFKIGGTKLATPVLNYPPSGATFYDTPRELAFDWKPVLGANQYWVDLQYYDEASKTWIETPVSPYVTGPTLGTGFMLTFPWAHKGRWCVKASDTSGAWLDSSPSAWRTFTFVV